MDDLKTKINRIMGCQNVIPCNLVNRNHSVHEPVASIYLEDETAGSSENLIPIYQTTCCHIQMIITLCHHNSTYAHDKGKRFLYTFTHLTNCMVSHAKTQ